MIDGAPLEACVGSYVVSNPRARLIRNLFEKEAPPWISTKPLLVENWSACLQTLDIGRLFFIISFSAFNSILLVENGAITFDPVSSSNIAATTQRYKPPTSRY